MGRLITAVDNADNVLPTNPRDEPGKVDALLKALEKEKMSPTEKVVVQESIAQAEKEKPVVQKPVIEKPVIPKLVFEKPVIPKLGFEKPVVQKPTVQEPHVQQSTFQQPRITVKNDTSISTTTEPDDYHPPRFVTSLTSEDACILGPRPFYPSVLWQSYHPSSNAEDPDQGFPDPKDSMCILGPAPIYPSAPWQSYHPSLNAGDPDEGFPAPIYPSVPWQSFRPSSNAGDSDEESSNPKDSESL